MEDYRFNDDFMGSKEMYGEFNHIMMAMETTISRNGINYSAVSGTPDEQEELQQSYRHLCVLRDEVIAMGVLPAIKEWHTLNPNLN